MRRIEIEMYPLGRTFATPEEAMHYGQNYGPLARTRIDEAQLVGSKIIWCVRRKETGTNILYISELD